MAVPIHKYALNISNLAIFREWGLETIGVEGIHNQNNTNSLKINVTVSDATYFTRTINTTRLQNQDKYWNLTTKISSKNIHAFTTIPDAPNGDDLKRTSTYIDGHVLASITSNLGNHFLQKLQDILKKNYPDNKFTVNDYAQALQMSHTQFYRKLKALTKQTPSQYIRNYRLEQAKILLKNPDFNISEIAYEVGFSDPNYFTRTFTKEFGSSPNAYKTQFKYLIINLLHLTIFHHAIYILLFFKG